MLLISCHKYKIAGGFSFFLSLLTKEKETRKINGHPEFSNAFLYSKTRQKLSLPNHGFK
jgi:hypothetical protein